MKDEVRGSGWIIRPDEDGTIDEVVVEKCSVHIERMDTNDFAITLTLPDGDGLYLAAATKRARVDIIPGELPEPK